MVKRQNEDHRKTFLVQNYDLIKNALLVLKNETSLRIIRVILQLIECSILKRIDEYSYDPESEFVDVQNIDFSFLDQFISYDGIEIYDYIKMRFRENTDIFMQITLFGCKYFCLEFSKE